MGYGWLLIKTFNPKLPSSKKTTIFYSNQLRDDLKLVTLHAIRQAKHSIHLQIYGFSDPDIKAAIEKAYSKGVDVEVFYDPKASPPIGYGYPVKSSGLMHRKICVIDKEISLIGTANFTTNSLKMHQNLVLGVYDPKLANYFIQSNEQNAVFEIHGTQVENFFLPDFDKAALKKLILWIDEAEKNINLALFTFTHPNLVKALTRAVQRGVNVSIAIDRYTARGASKKAIKILSEAGGNILINQGDALLHHKWALIDEKRFIFGSANWTKSAFERNQDLILFLDFLGHKEIDKLQKLWKIVAKGAKKY